MHPQAGTENLKAKNKIWEPTFGKFPQDLLMAKNILIRGILFWLGSSLSQITY